jgi:hypothetical protein
MAGLAGRLVLAREDRHGAGAGNAAEEDHKRPQESESPDESSFVDHHSNTPFVMERLWNFCPSG